MEKRAKNVAAKVKRAVRPRPVSTKKAAHRHDCLNLWFCILIVLLVVGLSICAFVWRYKRDHRTEGNNGGTTAQVVQPGDLELVGDSVLDNSTTPSVVFGSIINTTYNPIDNPKVVYHAFSDDGARLGDCVAQPDTSIYSHETVDFTATCSDTEEERVGWVELGEITNW